jgi:tetraacyldisaccharide 4'-kinase
MNPLSGLYGAGIALRNTLFDRGVLAALRLERPVVSVGNLSAGGAGKTPFVIALGELLRARGISFDVLSRGYGRKTRGVRVVDPAGTASEYGDEPLLIARRLGVPVVVGESRYEAGRVAERQFQTDVHLLDDGFQHRSLARDFDIVLMAVGDFEDRLLPIGRLREPVSSLGRADALVVPDGLNVSRALSTKLVWRTTREIEIAGMANVSGHRDEGLISGAEALHESDRTAALKRCATPKHATPEYATPKEGSSKQVPSPIVFCGIARPQQFFEMVRALGVGPVAEVAFRDHHAYDQGDIQRLLKMRDELGGEGFLTTEKDAINLGSLRSGLEPLAVATLRVTIDRPAELVDTILARIAGRKPRS